MEQFHSINLLIFKRLVRKCMQPECLILFLILLFLNSCISEFIPQTNADKQLLVVEGLITDQPAVNTVKLSLSLPLGTINTANPLSDCIVSISDDLGNTYPFSEASSGTYVTDPEIFKGEIGRKYSLHIKTNTLNHNYNYESLPVEMKPVPPIDSVYYEKKAIEEIAGIKRQEGCQVYLNTHDPANVCKFFRWEYTETWEIHIPYQVQNRVCWVSNNSSEINIKNTSFLEQDKIERFPLRYISNQTDRLKVKYSILVNQYSLTEDEYLYWEKMQNMSDQVGGLYDLIPSGITGNVYCIDNPNEKVLGYFSVSASSSKRIFIEDHFAGIFTPYTTDLCVTDTIEGNAEIPYLNVGVWIIMENVIPPIRVITNKKGCADCSVRGTTIEPDFWNEGK
jgi:hypothetical protein